MASRSAPKIHVGSIIKYRDSDNRLTECMVTSITYKFGRVMMQTNKTTKGNWQVLEAFFYEKKRGYMSYKDGGDFGSWVLNRKAYRVSDWQMKGKYQYMRWYMYAGKRHSLAVRVMKTEMHATYDVYAPGEEFICSGKNKRVGSAGRTACRFLHTYLKRRIHREAKNESHCFI